VSEKSIPKCPQHIYPIFLCVLRRIDANLIVLISAISHFLGRKLLRFSIAECPQHSHPVFLCVLRHRDANLILPITAMSQLLCRKVKTRMSTTYISYLFICASPQRCQPNFANHCIEPFLRRKLLRFSIAECPQRTHSLFFAIVFRRFICHEPLCMMIPKFLYCALLADIVRRRGCSAKCGSTIRDSPPRLRIGLFSGEDSSHSRSKRVKLCLT